MSRTPFEAPHEDPVMHRVMLAPVVEQRATLEAWDLAGAGLVHLLSSCHGGCFFCSNRTLTEMPPELVTAGADVDARLAGLEGAGVELLCVGGTEPATHPALDRILARARSVGAGVELMTSGLSLAEPGEAERWAAAGVVRVCVPLYAPVAALHDDVVERPGQYDQVVAGLDRARAAGIDVAVHTLALRRTLPAIRPLAARVADRWGSRLAVAPLRRKDDLFRYDAEAPSYREIEAALRGADVALVGFPACVAPELPRGGATVIRLYFRTQRLVHVAACEGCAARAVCRGVVPAHVEVYGERELRPR